MKVIKMSKIQLPKFDKNDARVELTKTAYLATYVTGISGVATLGITSILDVDVATRRKLATVGAAMMVGGMATNLIADRAYSKARAIRAADSFANWVSQFCDGDCDNCDHNPNQNDDSDLPFSVTDPAGEPEPADVPEEPVDEDGPGYTPDDVDMEDATTEHSGGFSLFGRS